MMAKMRTAQSMAPTQSGLQEGQVLFPQLKSLVEAGDIEGAKPILSKLKIVMTSFQSLPPLCQSTTTEEAERVLARNTLELAVFWSTQQSDTQLFQRHVTQLKPYYMGSLGASLPASQNRIAILGLNLLFLLVENRLAEFHSELELLTEAERAMECISFPIRLEQYLIVGSYDQVLEARSHLPHPYFKYFMESLSNTVRDAIAECIAIAYTSISVAAAQQMMRIESAEKFREFVSDSHPDWTVSSDSRTIVFKQPDVAKKSSSIPSMRLISENLSYATELERIV